MSSEKIEEEIRALVAGAVELMRARDFDSISQAYTAGGSLLLPGQAAANGRPAIRDAWAAFFPHPFVSLEYGPTRIDVSESGDMASEIGAYSFEAKGPGGSVSDRGKYLVVWRRIGDDWLIDSDAINSDGEG